MIKIAKTFVIFLLFVILAISVSKNDVLAISVRSDQSAVPLKSFKLSENAIYDCIDIYKQPGLDHPLLRNHTIQMKSSVSEHELKNHTGYNKVSTREIQCPDGTVPVMRITKKYITNAQRFAEKHFHLLTSDSPGTHIAGVRSRNGQFRGVEASFGGHFEISIKEDQASYSSIYIGSGDNNQVNFIQVGLMVNRGLFGDPRIWLYGFWKGKDGKGCYSMMCPGFVQISKEVSLSDPKFFTIHCSIHQDKQTENWWITLILPTRKLDIGYWPKELFNLLDNGASMVGAGGTAQSSHDHFSPYMGNGVFPDGEDPASFTNVKVLNSKYEQYSLNNFPIEELLDSPKCYGLITGGTLKTYNFKYGGPGGDSCGI